ncbi:hypothetical protein Trydic_g13245 [Trypoxylus dichotomus]
MASQYSTFHINGRVNKHNCVIWAFEHPKDVQEHMQNSPNVYLYCAVSKLGVTEPFLFEEQTAWRENYVAMLSTFIEGNVSFSSERTFSKTAPLPITV